MPGNLTPSTTPSPKAMPQLRDANLLSGSIGFVIGSINWSINPMAMTGSVQTFIFGQQVFNGVIDTNHLVLDADGDIGFAKLDAQLTVTWASGVRFDIKESLENSDGTWSNWEQTGTLVAW